MGFEPTTLRVLTLSTEDSLASKGHFFGAGLMNRIGAWFRISVAQFFFCVLLSLILYISLF